MSARLVASNPANSIASFPEQTFSPNLADNLRYAAPSALSIMGPRLLSSLTKLNDGHTIETFATDLTTIDYLRSLNQPGIPWKNNNQLVALCLERSTGEGMQQRTDISVVVDRPRVLESCLSQIARQSSKLEQFEFLFDFSLTPAIRNIHIHHVSIGRDESSPLRGRGLISETFAHTSAYWRQAYPEWTVSVIAQNPMIYYFMQREFDAVKLKNVGHRLPNDDYVEKSDRRKVCQGTVS